MSTQGVVLKNANTVSEEIITRDTNARRAVLDVADELMPHILRPLSAALESPTTKFERSGSDYSLTLRLDPRPYFEGPQFNDNTNLAYKTCKEAYDANPFHTKESDDFATAISAELTSQLELLLVNKKMGYTSASVDFYHSQQHRMPQYMSATAKLTWTPEPKSESKTSCPIVAYPA